MRMNTDELIANGNHFRSISQPEDAIACYAQAFVQDYNSAGAFNNYGNVLREMGYPERAVPFLANAIAIDPDLVTARFNLAVAWLLMGDYQNGFKQYEERWNYEHLAGTLPQFTQPRWRGEDVKGKTILFIGEQGHGDTIQFIRFVEQFGNAGAKIVACVDPNLVELFKVSLLPPTVTVVAQGDELPEFDMWTPMMSIPGHSKLTLATLPHRMQYLKASEAKFKEWQDRLGHKSRLRIGFAWSGRRDSWINQHKAMPFETMLDLIKRCPEYEWYNLQLDCTKEEENTLAEAGVKIFPGTVTNFHDTAGLVSHLDVVISVDTAVAHLSGALGRPTWIPLNQFGQDWRWLLNRDDSPWYPSARLFRQPTIGNWAPVVDKIQKFLTFFKI